jgi:hypothetical protein
MRNYSVKWTCPECGRANHGDAVLDLFPSCDCHAELEWAEVLSAVQLLQLAEVERDNAAATRCLQHIPG